MSNRSSKRAQGPIGNWLRKGANGSLGWPSTATISVSAPSMATLVSRAVAALPSLSRTRAPGRVFNGSGAAAAPANTSSPPAGAAGERRIGKVALDLTLFVEAPVRQDDDKILVHIQLVGFLDHDRSKQAAALLPGVGRARVGQIEVESQIGRGEADVDARAWGKSRPSQPSIPRDGVGGAQAGEAEGRRLGERVGEPQLQLRALLKSNKRTGNRPAVGQGRGRFCRRGEKARRAGAASNAITPSGCGAGVSARTAVTPQAATASPPPRNARRVGAAASAAERIRRARREGGNAGEMGITSASSARSWENAAPALVLALALPAPPFIAERVEEATTCAPRKGGIAAARLGRRFFAGADRAS